MTWVQEINDADTLAQVRLAWQSLLPQTRGATFFHTLDWLEVYWRHFGAGQRLRVLVVKAAGQLQGILPLAVRSERFRVGPLRVLTHPLHDWGTVYGPIGPNPTATLLAGLGHVVRTQRDWDLVDLRWVDPKLDAARTPHAMQSKGLAPLGRPMATCARIELRGSWDDYWAGRTSRWRNNVRRCEKQLAARGRVTHVRYRPRGAAWGDGDPRWDLYEACERVAQSSWQGSSTTGTTLSHESIRAFLRDAHDAAVREGCLDLNLLLLDDAPVAFNYAYHYRGHVAGLRTGFDRQAASEGAGSLLQFRMIRDSFERGDHTYDLGADYLACKRYWHTHLAETYRYTHFAPRSLRAQLLRLKHSVAARLA